MTVTSVTWSNPVARVRRECEVLPKDMATTHWDVGDSDHSTLHKKENPVDPDNLPERQKDVHVVDESQMADKDVNSSAETQEVVQHVLVHA